MKRTKKSKAYNQYGIDFEIQNFSFWYSVSRCETNSPEGNIPNGYCTFSLKNNLILKNDYYSILKHISKTNLPSKIKKFFKIRDLNKILSFMAKDKKNNSNKINLVLLKKIGYPIINREYKKNILAEFLKNELRN